MAQSLSKHPTISKVWIGPICSIDIRHPNHIKMILHSDKCIDRAQPYKFGFSKYKTGLLASNGELWMRHRKILNPAFNANNLKKFLPIVNEKAQKLTKAFDILDNKEAFNVSRLIAALTLESLLNTSFNLEKDFINNPNDKFFTIVKKEAANIGMNVSKSIINAHFLTKHEDEFSNFCLDMFNDAKKTVQSNYNDRNANFIELLMENQENLSQKEIIDEILTLIMAVSEENDLKSNLIEH
jgi:cytochrome P450